MICVCGALENAADHRQIRVKLVLLQGVPPSVGNDADVMSAKLSQNADMATCWHMSVQHVSDMWSVLTLL